MLKRLFGLFSTALFFMFAGQVFAAVPTLSVRLEQPKSPTGNNTFPITFVALSTDSDQVTVKCFKKGPSDGVFSQFGSTISLAVGGDTGKCEVNSSVVNQKGTYQFYANGNNGTENISSSIVSVDYDNEGPGTPTNYSKDKILSCQYKIKFRTSDDGGKTTKVELYRSDNTSFTADSGTRVDTRSMGSNTDAEFVNGIPDCNKTYYYVLRAFDNAGNGSGIIGDSNVTVVTGEATSSINTESGAVILNGDQSQVGDEEVQDDQEGVLGETVDDDNNNKNGFLEGLFESDNAIISFLIILAVLASAIYFYRQHKANDH